MSGIDETRREEARMLMMAALDGEISPQQRKRLDEMLAEDELLRKEWKSMNEVKVATGSMGYDPPPEEFWDKYWTSVYNRIERGVGWVLVSLGVVVLIGYGLWRWLETLLADSGMPGFLKAAIFAVVIGLVILIVSVLREKVFLGSRERYKEVQR